MSRRLLTIACVVIASVAILSGAACSGAPTPTPTLASDPWAADGVITAREYSGSNRYGDCEVFWRSEGEFVYLGVRAPMAGWLAIGVQPGERMKDADLIIGLVRNGQVRVSDHFSTGDFGPHSEDTQLGGTDDILESGGREEAGLTTIEFKRRLATGDRYDHPLAAGVNKIIWAFASDDDATMRHARRGYGEIDLR